MLIDDIKYIHDIKCKKKCINKLCKYNKFEDALKCCSYLIKNKKDINFENCGRCCCMNTCLLIKYNNLFIKES